MHYSIDVAEDEGRVDAEERRRSSSVLEAKERACNLLRDELQKAQQVGASVVRSWARIPLVVLQNLVKFVYPTLPVFFGRDTISNYTPLVLSEFLSGVLPGEVKYPTQ